MCTHPSHQTPLSVFYADDDMVEEYLPFFAGFLGTVGRLFSTEASITVADEHLAVSREVTMAVIPSGDDEMMV